MAGEERKSRFTDCSVYVQEVWCVWAYVSVIILFIEPWTLGFCAIILAHAYTTPTLKNVQYMCVCVSVSWASLSSLSLLSFQAWPTSYCTVVLVLYEPVVATVDPLICSAHSQLQEGNREPGQLLPRRPDLTTQSFTSRRFQQLFPLTDNYLMKAWSRCCFDWQKHCKTAWAIVSQVVFFFNCDLLRARVGNLNPAATGCIVLVTLHHCL